MEGVHIDLRKQENITSDYRKINPQGTVPAMQSGNNIICGSTKIILYLEEHYPGTRLLSASEGIRQQEIDFCYSHEALHDPYIRLLSYINIFMNPENHKKLDIEHILQLAENHPRAQAR